jgi:hypothetical protein
VKVIPPGEGHSSQACLLLLAHSLLLLLAGRFVLCFLEAPQALLAAFDVAAPDWTLHEKLSSSSPPFVSKLSLAYAPLATQFLYIWREAE